jgi:hypothetical protein
MAGEGRTSHLAALAAALFIATSAAAADAPAKVPGSDPDFYKFRWPSGDVSVNDRCAVRQNKLNPKIEPVWVNGRPVGFC